ncbi:RHS repeat-associated protein [Luteibacter jiangsuensis]|uniref:RHS repeat-associated protein n=1 Tax=Luteibacter jiangsuensis TaxID=637577 RepID=A0ABT9T1L8_9GAMM|nr:RHS repeat-associated core domain-containing protein [Luteibacter jiangsuensis]MDQ0011175.1 RHS repeat-associated protein [Luteibacter jiangsuensis]
MTVTITTTTTPVYGAYGERSGSSGRSQSAFAGEVLEADAGWYMLGERAYSPALRRFIAPDGASPFDGGGVNRYAYCGGDPVNRIDPSGHTWLGWVGASLGLTAPAGAARGVSPASRMQETVSTPVTVTTTAAAVTDAVSITSAIDSVALMTSDRPNSGGLFGWVAVAASAGSSGTSLPPARNGASTERFLGLRQDTPQRGRGKWKPKRDIHVVSDPQIPAERLSINRFGKLDLATEWAFGAHDRNPNSVIWAPDSSVNGQAFTKVFQLLSRHGVKEVNVYTGAHGEPYGRNWHLRTGERLDVEPKFFLEDLVHTKRAARATGVTINPINMALLNRQQMQHHLLKDGVHLIGSCFGLSDEVVMEALNIQQATVYLLT